MARLFIRQAIARPEQTAPRAHHYQPLRADRTAQTGERQGREVREHRPQLYTEATRGGAEGVTGDVGTPRALA
jgi:hypothetical protein